MMVVIIIICIWLTIHDHDLLIRLIMIEYDVDALLIVIKDWWLMINDQWLMVIGWCLTFNGQWLMDVSSKRLINDHDIKNQWLMIKYCQMFSFVVDNGWSWFSKGWLRELGYDSSKSTKQPRRTYRISWLICGMAASSATITMCGLFHQSIQVQRGGAIRFWSMVISILGPIKLPLPWWGTWLKANPCIWYSSWTTVVYHSPPITSDNTWPWSCIIFGLKGIICRLSSMISHYKPIVSDY